ncbi:thioredoxin family protein [Flavobacterium sp.]
MNTIIQNSLANSHTYVEYRAIISALLKEGKSTGNEPSDDLTNYSQLNQTRMNRLEKTIEITPEVTNKLQKLTKDYLWLVIAEGWCGDAAQLVPIFHKMADVSPKVEMKIVLRDENDALMNLFLTNGSKSVPKLIIIDKSTNEVVGDFGPRPIGAKQLILDYKAQHGIVDETAKIELQKWYLHDKGISTQNEIMDILGV